MENNQEMPELNWNYLLLTSTERFIYDACTLGRKLTPKQKMIKVIAGLLHNPFKTVKVQLSMWALDVRIFRRKHITRPLNEKVNQILFNIFPKKYYVCKSSYGHYTAMPFAIVPFTGGIRELSSSEGNGYVRYKHMEYTMKCYRLKTAKEAMDYIIQENNNKIDAETQEKLNQLLSSGGIQNKEEV